MMTTIELLSTPNLDNAFSPSVVKDGLTKLGWIFVTTNSKDGYKMDVYDDVADRLNRASFVSTGNHISYIEALVECIEGMRKSLTDIHVVELATLDPSDQQFKAYLKQYDIRMDQYWLPDGPDHCLFKYTGSRDALSGMIVKYWEDSDLLEHIKKT